MLSSATRTRDYGIKLEDCEAHKIAEYWIVDPQARTLKVRTLDGDNYALRTTLHIDDRLSSQVIPNFNIPMRAIFEEQTYLAALTGILQS